MSTGQRNNSTSETGTFFSLRFILIQNFVPLVSEALQAFLYRQVSNFSRSSKAACAVTVETSSVGGRTSEPTFRLVWSCDPRSIQQRQSQQLKEQTAPGSKHSHKKKSLFLRLWLRPLIKFIPVVLQSSIPPLMMTFEYVFGRLFAGMLLEVGCVSRHD